MWVIVLFCEYFTTDGTSDWYYEYMHDKYILVLFSVGESDTCKGTM